MASKTIAWTTGGGNITLSYGGQGNGSVSVSSSQNESFDARSQSVYLSTTIGSPEKNIAVTITQKGKSYSPGDVFNFDYTGSVQSIVLPKGKYKLQCWGAQGGRSYASSSYTGSKGGYSEGVLTLTKTTTLYVFVGGKGSYGSSTSLLNGGWNGGGASVGYSYYSSGDEYGESYPACGGGATDIATVTSSMSYSSGRTNRSSASLLSRIIVAGGGAGASYRYTEIKETITDTNEEVVDNITVYCQAYTASFDAYYGTTTISCNPGEKYYLTDYDGGVNCAIEVWNSSMTSHLSSAYGENNTITIPSGGGKIVIILWGASSGDIARATLMQIVTTSETVTDTSSGYSNKSQQGGGVSGKGQYPGSQTSAGSGGALGLGANQTTTNYRYVSGAGGGGWYGGGRGYSDSSISYVNYSGGGSGFVNTADNASYRPSGYTGLQLDSGVTKAGNTSFESVSGGVETGHSGNGYARITVL